MDRSSFKSVVVYPTALCNLKCRYCYVDKNKYLEIADKELAKSFEGNYYIDYLNELLNNDLSNIKLLQLWGSESTLFMNRPFGFIHSLIEQAPNFNSLMLSTNLSHDKIQTAIHSLIDLFGSHPDRNFNITLQISIDGSSESNDKSRGLGVTDAVVANFNELIKNKFYMGKYTNIKLRVIIKSTIDLDSINLFTDIDFIIRHYRFFEDSFLGPWMEMTIDDDRFEREIPPPVGNFATPAAATQDDGKLLASICKLTREIEALNKDRNIFKYYKEITFFGYKGRKGYKSINIHDYRSGGGFCGGGKITIGMLPNRTISSCHRTFVDFIGSHEEKVENKLIATATDTMFASNHLIYDNEDNFNKYCLNINNFCDFDKKHLQPTAILVNATLLIRTLAMAGQIDEKYIDEKEALIAARFIAFIISKCPYDLFSTTGSLISIHTGVLKFYLNGAIDYMLESGIDIDD